MNNDSEPDLQELKDTYSFNESLLKKCFIDEGTNVFQKYQLLAKVNNILIFRKKYEEKFNFPQLLFTFSTKIESNSTIYKSIIRYFCSLSKLNNGNHIKSSNLQNDNNNYNNNSNNESPSQDDSLILDENFDISDILINVFLKTQLNLSIDDNLKQKYNWIIDYFLYSTFPSLFGHFCSFEYLREGFAFISLLIHDKIAPRLVGIYLHHSFIFKDRVLSYFFRNITKKASKFLSNSEEGLDSITESDVFKLESIESIFYESFSSCISYFSIFHFKAVDLLLKVRGEDAAIEAVWDYFILDELVEHWQYSPLFSTMAAILAFPKDDPQSDYIENFENFENSRYPKYWNVLSEFLHQIKKEKIKSIQIKYVNLFHINSKSPENDDGNGTIYFNMPKISDIIFFKGTFFAITKFDLDLGLIIKTLLKQISSASTITTYESISSAIINYPGLKIIPKNEAQLIYNSVNILLKLSHIFPNEEKFPNPPDQNKSTIFDKLMYNKDVHNILYKKAGGLVTAKTILGSIEKNILLASSAYAAELFGIMKKYKKDHQETFNFKCNNDDMLSNLKKGFNAAFYGEGQRRLFVLYLIEMIIETIESFSKFMHSFLGSEFPNALSGDVSNILKVKLSEEWANNEIKKQSSSKTNSNNSSHNDDQINMPASSYSLSSSASSVTDFSLISLDIVSKTLIKTAEKIVNSWKYIYNGKIEEEQNNQQKLNDIDLKVETFQPVTGIFVFVTNEITKALVYITLSSIPHPIIPKVEFDGTDENKIKLVHKERENSMRSIVNSHSLRVPFLDSDLSISSCLADPYISFYFDVAHDVQTFLFLLEKSFQNEFLNFFKSKNSFYFCEQFNIGWKMQTFIQLESMLNPIINNSKLNQNTFKMLIMVLLNGNDPYYLRLNLINVSKVVKTICTPIDISNPSSPSSSTPGDVNANSKKEVQKVEYEKIVGKINSLMIHDIFGHDVVDKFKNLEHWFSLIDDV